MNFYKNIKRGGILLALSVAVLPGASVAQQYYDPGLLQKTVDRKPVDYQAPGVRMGSFMLKPGAELAYENNHNIYYSTDKGISDSIIHIRPWANLASDWGRHSIEINAFADIARYNDFGSEDYEDLVLTLDGRVDVMHKSNFNYKASYMQLHEDRSSPDDVNGVAPTEFTYSGAEIGYNHAFNRLELGLNYRVIDTDYDNNKDADGNILDTQDRDRTRDSITLRGDYELSPQRTAFLSLEGNQVDYDQKFDDEGFERSSDGYTARAGLGWNLTGVISGDVYLQYMDQDYDDERLGSISGAGIGGSFDWTPTKLTNFNFRFANSPQETTRGFTSGYNSKLYSARLQHELRRNLLANLRFSYTDNDYESNGVDPIALTDTGVIRAGFGMSYLFNRNVSLSGGFIYEDQDANAKEFEYSNTRWFLTLGLEL